METVGRTLKGVFGFSRSGDFPKLWANRPSGFLRYALHRNRGYFQRRFLNFANELVEIGCLALVFNPGLLRSLVLIPLTHILINYLSEYHWQLYRTIPDSWREKKVNPIDIGLWVLAGALMAGTGGWIFTRNDRDPVLLGLVAIRFVAVVLQLGLAPRIARLTSLKRVRPNIPLIWGGAFSVWILALLPAIGSPAYWYGFWVTGWFNFNKIVQEWSYFRRVEEEKRRQRLILPRSINREHTRRHFYFVLAMVVLHLGLIGAFCYHFKLEHSRLSPLVVFFVASFLDRLNGRPVRSLALDFDELRRRRLRLLGRGMVRRVLLISGVLVCLSEGYLLMHRNLSGLAIFGLAYVAIQGVVNQIWIYASIGADQRQGTHPVAKVLAFQMFAVAALFLTGPAGAWAFVAGAVFNLLFTLRGLDLPVSRPAVMGPGMMIQFDWVKVLPLWKEFRAWADAKEVRWLSLNRKTKVIYVKDWDEWFALLARFPLNLKNWKRIDCLPERLPVQTPDSVRIAYCDFFGFWRFQDDRSLVPDEQSLHLHKTHRDWQDYPYRLGGKRKWKAMPRDGTAYHAGPADLEGTELWIDS